MPFDIVAATRNRGKLAEIQALLGSAGAGFKPAPANDINLLSLNDFPEIGEIPEEGDTFEENALIKARTVSSLTSKIAMADDSGIAVDALNGRPGVLSARYSGENATDEWNNLKLLDELRGIPREQRGARFICVIAIVRGSEEMVVRGECPGVILEEGRGSHGFGYDPLFYYSPAGKTFSEMEPEEKNRISHRARALAKLKEKLPEFLSNVKTG